MGLFVCLKLTATTMDPRLAIRTAVEKGIEAVKAYKDLEAQFQLLDQGSSHPDLVALAACHEDMVRRLNDKAQEKLVAASVFYSSRMRATKLNG